MKKYDQYKKTGVEWLGEIPEHWETLPIRAIFEERNEKNDGPKTDFILSVTKDRGVIPYDEKGAIGNNKSEDIERYKVVYEGDFVINKMNVVIGSLGMSKYFGAFSQVYLVYKPKSTKIYINYYSYIFSNPSFYKSLIRYCTGIMELRESLNKDDFKKLILPLPEYSLQMKIVSFLDDKTIKIDQAINIKQKQIELIKERKQLLIHRAVTRGLNDKVKLKYSGVEWIGEIPEHWTCVKFKYIIRTKARLGWKGLKAAEYVDKSEYGFLSTPNIKTRNIDFENAYFITKRRYDESPEIILEIGDVLLVKDGSTLGITNIVRNLPFNCTVNSSIAVMRVMNLNKLLPEYLDYFLKSETCQRIIEKKKDGMGVPHLFQSDINNFSVPIFSLSEQKEIVYYIETNNQKIDLAISLKEQEIEKLKEYKMSLIDGVVTGKVKVC